MFCSLVCLCFAMPGPWLGVTPSDSQTVPASLSARVQTGASRIQSGQSQTANSAEKESCRKFVGEFYSWYVGHSKKGDPLRVALRVKKANFSPELIRRLMEDYAASAKSPGEIVGLDFDAVLNSQDMADKYLPGKVTQDGHKFLVEVFSAYSGKQTATPAVTPELRREHGQWVFTNFLYKSDGKSDDLLSILAKLRADRRKGK